MLRSQLVGSKFLPEYAGAGLRIHNTYRRLAEHDDALSWRVIAGSTEYVGDCSYLHDGVEVERIASRLFADRRQGKTPISKLVHALRSWCEAARVWRRLRGRNFDVLHVFGSSSVTAAAIAWAVAWHKPVVVELVTTEAAPWQSLPGLRIGAWLRRRLHRRTLIVAISAPLAERCARAGFNKNVWSRPNPIDTARFFPDFQRRAELRARHTRYGRGDIVLCMIAKFMPQKNQIFLLDVLAKLSDRFKLVLAGPVVTEGPLRARDEAYVAALHRRIDDLGLGDRVLVVPRFVPADEFIKLADIYMLPNRDEGLATPMLESLACGVPVVANAGEPAFQQWIEPERNGFLCRLEPAAWAAAIEQAAQMPRQRLAAAAQAIAAAASAEIIDRQFLRLLKALAALPPNTELDVAATLKDAR